jgi:hypothetical protein
MAVVILEGDENLTNEFMRAENVVATIFSRLQANPASVDPIMRPLHNWKSLLWALRQQVVHGPCEEIRGSKDYASQVQRKLLHSEQESLNLILGSSQGWFTCCASFGRENRL